MTWKKLKLSPEVPTDYISFIFLIMIGVFTAAPQSWIAVPRTAAGHLTYFYLKNGDLNPWRPVLFSYIFQGAVQLPS